MINNNRSNIIVVYLILFALLLVLSPFVFKLLDNSLTFTEMINDDFFTIILLVPIYLFSKYDYLSNLPSIIILLCTTIPIVLSLKTKKYMPFIIIYFLSISFWFFIGLIAFGIRNGEE